VSLIGPSGQKGRTQVAHTSLGHSWEVTGGAERSGGEPSAPRAPRAPTVRRRRSVGPEAVEEIVVASPDPAPAAEEPQRPIPSAGPVPKGSPIRMLAGIYQGYTGKVASVQAKTGQHGTEAIYMLSLTGPTGERARTSVKHTSLGRMWVRA